MGRTGGRWAGTAGRRPAGWLACCVATAVACLTTAPGAALAEGSSPGEGSGASTALGGPLVVAGSPTQGEQAQAGEAARLASPEARVAREKSRTAFAGLSAGAAAKLAGEAFPGVVDRPAGGPPQLPAGQKIVGYLADNAAQVDLGGGKHAVIESMEPLVIETSRGHRQPIDLSLDQAGGAFQPARSAVGLRIPTRLGDGVQLTGTGVSLTPVDAQGAALGGSEGTVDGASVLYANTQTDADTVVKPTTLGFEADTLLRSVDSPEELYFRVGLPAGASLVQAKDGSGAVSVVAYGNTLATVLPPSAQDAARTPVPVSMSVTGDILKLSVDDSSGEYQYPIEVDPSVEEKGLEVSTEANWHVSKSEGSSFAFGHQGVEGHGEGISDFCNCSLVARGAWARMGYETKGESHIYEFVGWSKATGRGNETEASLENKFNIESPGTSSPEKEVALSESYSATEITVCVESGCAPGTVSAANDSNQLFFKQTVMNEGADLHASIDLSPQAVYIVQEHGPTASINTSSETIEGQPNVFYPGKWAGPRGMMEIKATDPGLGVSGFQIKSSNKPGWTWSGGTGTCKGVQCPSSGTLYEDSLTRELPNGEDSIEAWGEDPAKLTGTAASGKVKVDFTKPYAFTLAGLPADKEMGEGSYKLKVTAKDELSGIESVSLKVDGREVGTANGSCSGACTATGEWTVSGSEFPAGQHTITASATSYAGDVASGEEYTFDTGHPAVPVGLGPGSMSPETGEFFLNASDVSVGGPGGGLSVKRSYSSYHLKAGAEGPLGPQWHMSVGGSESLTKGEGFVVLTNGEGAQSVFTSNGKGGFTSPPLSASLTLTEVGGEFVLTSTAGTVTKFKLPTGGTGNTYVPSTLEGPGATNVMTYAFKTVGGITEPTEVLAPVPAGVTCTTLVKGCRALTFVYATKTKESIGEGPSEWGEYEGRLKEVTFTAWEPKEGKMVTKAVADYTYDKAGRLRGEWNPQISPELETTYGYDSAGHITAMTPPGQQPWLFAYGSSPGNPRAAILSVTRPAASTVAGNGVAPANTGAPSLASRKIQEGGALSVNNGTWSNSPLSYSYQWEGCVPVYGCTPILGATSQTYTPWEEKAEERLSTTYLVQVTATNADGSTTVASNQSELPEPAVFFEKKATFGAEGSAGGDVKEPSAIAVENATGAEGNVWVADTGNDRVDELSASGTFIKAFGWHVEGKAEFQVCTKTCEAGTAGSGNGQFEKPVGIALSQTGEYVYVADSGNKRIEVFEAKTGKYVSKIVREAAPAGIAVGNLACRCEEEHHLYVAIPSKDKVEDLTIVGGNLERGKTPESFGKEGSGNGELIEPTGVAAREKEAIEYNDYNVFVTDKGNHRVEVFEQSPIEVEYTKTFGTAGSGEGELLDAGRHRDRAGKPQGAGTARRRPPVL